MPASEYDAVRDELIERLEALPGPGGPIGTRVHRPEDLWAERRGIPPDLVVYFGDLAWRSNGSVGHGRYYTFDNDTGPDDANHSRYGLCVVTGDGVPSGRRDDLVIYDVAPTILRLAGLTADGGIGAPREAHVDRDETPRHRRGGRNRTGRRRRLARAPRPRRAADRRARGRLGLPSRRNALESAETAAQERLQPHRTCSCAGSTWGSSTTGTRRIDEAVEPLDLPRRRRARPLRDPAVRPHRGRRGPASGSTCSRWAADAAAARRSSSSGTPGDARRGRPLRELDRALHARGTAGPV